MQIFVKQVLLGQKMGLLVSVYCTILRYAVAITRRERLPGTGLLCSILSGSLGGDGWMFFLSLLSLYCQLEIIHIPEWHILGRPALDAIRAHSSHLGPGPGSGVAVCYRPGGGRELCLLGAEGRPARAWGTGNERAGGVSCSGRGTRAGPGKVSLHKLPGKCL